MHQRSYETSQELTQSIALASRICPDAACELVRVVATRLRTAGLTPMRESG
jgi:hypothetical protein